MVKQLCIILLLLCPALAWGQLETCQHSGPDQHDGDCFDSWWCDSQELVHIWDNMHMYRTDFRWFGTGGFDPCNLETGQTGRLINTFWLLEYAGDPSFPPWLEMGYNYVAFHVQYWWPGCASPDGRIADESGSPYPYTVTLYNPFFWGWGPSVRAAVMVHEARHTEGIGHIADNLCPNHGSCDHAWDDVPAGANSYGTHWAAEFVDYSWFGHSLQNEADYYANWVLSGAYQVRTHLKHVPHVGIVWECWPNCYCPCGGTYPDCDSCRPPPECEACGVWPNCHCCRCGSGCCELP